MINKKIGWLVVFVIFGISAYFSFAYFSPAGGGKLFNPLGFYKKPVANNGTASEEPSEPKTEPCPINGELLTKTQKSKWEKRRPLGIMIENHKDARPQSGISMADVVYEAVAEGGITRFLTVFYCKDASYVGPVRSARIYFIKILEEYGNYPLYAHVGGANTPGPADALGEISDLEWSLYNDLNQFAVPFPYYWRDYERLPNRATEHTVYSSTSKLWDYTASKRKLTNVDEDNKPWDENFVSWKFQDDAKEADRGSKTKIDFGFWKSFASDFSVSWAYDKTSNTYKRTNGGQPHIDKNTGKQLATKNVVIIFAKESPANDGYEGGHLLYKVTGSGDGIIFQNGNAEKITWEKKDETTRMKLYDSNDKEVSFVRGQIWFEILPIGNEVEY